MKTETPNFVVPVAYTEVDSAGRGAEPDFAAPPAVYYAGPRESVGRVHESDFAASAFSDGPPPIERDLEPISSEHSAAPDSGWIDTTCCPRTWEQLDCREAFRADREHMWSRLADDGCGLLKGYNTLYLGGALALAIGLRQDADDKVREATDDHPERWGEASVFLGKLGEIQYQAPVLLGVYGYSLYHHDEELHDLSGTMISAFALAGVTTITIKAIANTDRPSDEWNGGQFGFPSYHTSSSFSIAAVLDEYYGPKAGLPAYTVASLIAWSRIDERDHDLSDVVFGAALGWVIGKSVAGNHLRGDSRIHISPYMHPLDGSPGVAFHTEY